MAPHTLPGILLVAFGVTTRYGKPALGSFTAKVKTTFPGHAVQWAFTTRHKAKRPTLGKGEPGLAVPDALALFAARGIFRVAVQPLHLVAGREYAALNRRIAAWRKLHPEMKAATGRPLLADEEAMLSVLEAMRSVASPECPGEASVWVGHGSRDSSTAPYARMAELAAGQNPPVFLGCLSGGPDADHIGRALQARDTTAACLMPFFALSGYHAARDMAGKTPASWRSRLAEMGIPCRAHLKGMIEYDIFAAMWLARLREALSRV